MARALVTVLAFATSPLSLQGQVDTDTMAVEDPAAADSAVLVGVSPGRAFLRAVLLPGWGHASIGSYGRGAFYFAAQTSTVWTLIRTRARLRSAKDARDLRRSEVAAALAAQGVSDRAEVEIAQDADAAVSASEGLVRARGQQFEDWLAFGLFMVFLSGADAFVSTHLRDFPEPIEMEIRAAEGGVEVGLSVPVR